MLARQFIGNSVFALGSRPNLELLVERPVTTYLNTISRLMRKKFIKTMLLYLYVAESLEFNEECSIAAIDQTQ